MRIATAIDEQKKNQKQNRLDCNKSSDNDSSLFNWNSGKTHSKYKEMTILYKYIYTNIIHDGKAEMAQE